MKLLTVILNFRTPELTLRAVAAADKAMARFPSARIDIVDNDSRDGSFETIRAGIAGYDPARVRLLASPRNGGFGAGNNHAIRGALAEKDPPELIYILNSDAFPREDAIEALVTFLDTHRQAGFAGSYIHGVDNVPHETAFRFPTVWSEIESGLGLGLVSRLLEKYRVPILPMPTETREVDWLAGASLMMRASVLREIGLFDESFFLYFEETDLCRRAKRAGHSTWYVVESRVAHIGSASTGMKKWQRIPTYWLDSRAHYFEKNHGAAYLRAANAASAAALGIFRVRRVLQRKADPYPPGYYADFVRYNLLGDKGR
jgi:N-acetylglucosaminyl-diphospho-decaprenol L-rhamnosyltransferase